MDEVVDPRAVVQKIHLLRPPTLCRRLRLQLHQRLPLMAAIDMWH